jgi:protein-disulfide isomerase
LTREIATQTRLLFAARAVAVLGLLVSVLLAYDYAQPVHALCGPGGGCEAIRLCWQRIAPSISLPWVGIVSYSTALVALLITAEQPGRRILPVLGTIAAVAGLSLIITQRAVCHDWCKFCLVTDGSAIVLGALLFSLKNLYQPAPISQRWLFGGLGSLAVIVALFVGIADPQPSTLALDPAAGPAAQRVDVLPGVIETEQRPGLVAIVEFADFECPFCREQHNVLTTVLPSYEGRVRLVRKQLPLSMHPHADIAARMALCAEEQHRGEPMANALFRAGVDELTVEHFAGRLSEFLIERAPWEACLQNERTTSHIRSDRNAASEAGVSGLPTMFIGHERFDGLIGEAALRASIERALHPELRADAAADAP